MTAQMPPGPPRSSAIRWSREEKATLLIWDYQEGVWHAVSATQPTVPKSWRRDATATLAAEKLGLAAEVLERSQAAERAAPQYARDDLDSDEGQDET